jgi:hypothetical protein
MCKVTAVCGSLISCASVRVTSTDMTVVTVMFAIVRKRILYIAKCGAANVTAQDITTAATVNGNFLPNGNLACGQTPLTEPSGPVTDKNGGLLVSNLGAPSVTGYADALNLGSIRRNVGLRNRAVQPDVTLIVTRAANLAAIAGDSAGNG